jgi:hypothetical protein
MTKINRLSIVYEEGTESEHIAWFEDNEVHREDGAALIYKDGRQFWFYKGEFINCSSQQEFERIIKLKALW